MLLYMPIKELADWITNSFSDLVRREMDEVEENIMKNNDRKTVSVLMSVYNERDEWLRQSIESILNQTWRDFEFIIINDNPSNKFLPPLLYEYMERDKRIKIIRNETNRGLAWSMNEALKYAKGKYIARMDADDISMPERLEKEVCYLEQYPLDMVASNAVTITEKGEKIGNFGKMPRKKNIERLLLYRDMIIHPSVLIKRQILEKLGGYRNFASAQDYDLWLRMVTANCKIGILDEPLIYYRLRDNGITRTNHYRQFLMAKYARKLYKERKKHKGSDSFSEESMGKYIAEKYTDKKKRRFDKASGYFNCASVSLGNGQKIKSLAFILKSMITDYNYIGDLFRLLIYKVRKASLTGK